MAKTLAIVAVVGLFPVVSPAAAKKPAWVAKSCVTVAAAAGEGRVLPRGSGALIVYKGAPAILTCRHLFDRNANGPFYVRFHDQKTWRQVVLARKTKRPLDLAILTFKEKTTLASLGARPLRIAIDAMKKDDPVYCSGAFKNANNDPPFFVLESKVFALKPKSNRFAHRCWTHWGHSGSPMFNSKGEICGVHIEYDNKTYLRTAMDLAAIKEFVGLRLFQPPTKRRANGEKNPYEFTVLVDGGSKELKTIKKVTFHMHRGTFTPPDRKSLRIRNRHAYSWSGWGTFTLRATIEFTDGKRAHLQLPLRLD